MSDQGKANYEAYRDFAHGKSLVSGAVLPEWDGLPHEIQAGWNAGADAVEQWLSQAPVDEDAPGNEPAKVIIVTETGGRDRHYAADSWDAEDAVDVTRNGTTVATYPPGSWTRIHLDGATLPDVTARKLSLAMQALQEIGATVLEADDKRASVVRIARDVLEQIADVDL